ncbi:MAG: polysaccharide biosynthesis/export family protein [Bacteroidales bacterium]|nr:polysaccharide biosynthesis/export family protein [Bacteroidales bacterium]
MKIHSRIVLLSLFMMLLLSSCLTPGKLPYLKNVEDLPQSKLKAAAMVYEAKIMPKDMLSIVITSKVAAATEPFRVGDMEYIVESDGYIELPTLGRIRVEGMTRFEVQELIKSLLYPKYLAEQPLVKVKFINYKITVIGEVRAPGTFTIDRENCTIYEALARAGDLAITGRRDNVKILRQNGDGEISIFVVDLQDKNLILYPSLYYLQQNDLVYVQPAAQVALSQSTWVMNTLQSSIWLLSSVMTAVITYVGLVKNK